MSEPEKPLHVRVAEALGWTMMQPGGVLLTGAYVGYPPTHQIVGQRAQVPWFDRDWNATGPLIEQYGIELSFNGERWFATGHHPWDKDLGREPACMHIGRRAGFAPCADESEKPLESVCKAILAMKDAGLIE